MSNDFICVSQRPRARKKYTFKNTRQSTMMSGALPSPPADGADHATSTRKNASANYIYGSNGTPPSAQRPLASQDSSASPLPIKGAIAAAVDEQDMISPDDVDDDALLAPTPEKPGHAKTKSQPRNAFTVLASSQAAMRTTPAARRPMMRWTADEEWTVVQGIRSGLSHAQIRELLPVERSGSAIRGKKMELQEKYGEKLKTMARPTPRTPAPPVPLRKTWSAAESRLLWDCMSNGLSDRDIQALHFPNRTEDSVIGKLRKLRATTVKPHTAVANATLLSSRLPNPSSSPAVLGSSSQTVQRSSPAQAARKRKAESTARSLPAVQEEAVHVDQPDEITDDTVTESLTEHSPTVAESFTSNSSTRSRSARTAYVVLPKHTDMSDVADLRAGPLVQVVDVALDREAKYVATTPPFRPGQESDIEGVLSATKLGLWREAYSRCRGNVEAAYHKYESLRTDEHMMQAVCNLDYEIVNGIKAVRMRRLREDAIREGRPPPVTPVKDQPKHLDLFGEKHYSKYFTYTPWRKETEDMYLNEPITYGARPVDGVPVDYVDPMQEGMYDEREGEERHDDDRYDDIGYAQDVEHGQLGGVAFDEERRIAVTQPFHGHVTEIADDEDVESSDALLSHCNPESALVINISEQVSKKRKHTTPEQSPVSPPTKKQNKLEESSDQVHCLPEATNSPPSAKGQKLEESPQLEHEASEESTVPLSWQEQEAQMEGLGREPEVLEESMASLEEGITLTEENTGTTTPGRQETQQEGLRSEHFTAKEDTAPGFAKKQKKEKEKKTNVPRLLRMQDKQNKSLTREQPARLEREAPPPTNKQKKTTKKMVIGKGGAPVSTATIRRQRKALRRSDASTISEVSTQRSKAGEKKGVILQNGKEVPPLPVAVHVATVEQVHPEDNPSQWMRDIVKNAKHKPPPIHRKSPPPVDPNNLFGRGDPSDSSAEESESDSDVES